MLKFGIISESKPGYARVQFDDDDMVSDWLPVAVSFSMSDKVVWTLRVQEQVACLMDEQCENGVIIGATYNTDDTSPTSNATMFMVQFSDGTKLQYDKSAHELKADVAGKVTVNASGDIKATATGDVEATGQNIKATGIVKISVIAPSVEVTAPVIKLTGAVTVEGMITAGGISIATGLGGGNGKMVGDGDIETTGSIKGASVKQGTVELGAHTHSGVQTGGGVSGPPVP